MRSGNRGQPVPEIPEIPKFHGPSLHQPHQIPPANTTGFQPVACRAAPVGLQAEPAVVAVAAEGGNLAGPVDAAGAEFQPLRGVAGDAAVLDVHVGDAAHRELGVAIGERRFAGDQGVGGVPNEKKQGPGMASRDIG